MLLVDHLCDDVESGRAIGNLCKEICGGALDSYNCQALHGGKEVVFSAQFHANPVFVKGIFFCLVNQFLWRWLNLMCVSFVHFGMLSM